MSWVMNKMFQGTQFFYRYVPSLVCPLPKINLFTFMITNAIFLLGICGLISSEACSHKQVLRYLWLKSLTKESKIHSNNNIELR